MEFMEANLRRSDNSYSQINLVSFREEVYRHQLCVHSPTDKFLDVAQLDNSQLSDVLHIYARLPVSEVSQLLVYCHILLFMLSQLVFTLVHYLNSLSQHTLDPSVK